MNTERKCLFFSSLLSSPWPSFRSLLVCVAEVWIPEIGRLWPSTSSALTHQKERDSPRNSKTAPRIEVRIFRPRDFDVVHASQHTLCLLRQALGHQVRSRLRPCAGLLQCIGASECNRAFSGDDQRPLLQQELNDGFPPLLKKAKSHFSHPKTIGRRSVVVEVALKVPHRFLSIMLKIGGSVNAAVPGQFDQFFLSTYSSCKMFLVEYRCCGLVVAASFTLILHIFKS